MHITMNSNFNDMYNSKFHKSTKSSGQSRPVTWCSQCSGIFIIALTLYDHAFIVQKLFLYFNGR